MEEKFMFVILGVSFVFSCLGCSQCDMERKKERSRRNFSPSLEKVKVDFFDIDELPAVIDTKKTKWFHPILLYIEDNRCVMGSGIACYQKLESCFLPDFVDKETDVLGKHKTFELFDDKNISDRKTIEDALIEVEKLEKETLDFFMKEFPSFHHVQSLFVFSEKTAKTHDVLLTSHTIGYSGISAVVNDSGRLQSFPLFGYIRHKGGEFNNYCDLTSDAACTLCALPMLSIADGGITVDVEYVRMPIEEDQKIMEDFASLNGLGGDLKNLNYMELAHERFDSQENAWCKLRPVRISEANMKTFSIRTTCNPKSFNIDSTSEVNKMANIVNEIGHSCGYFLLDHSWWNRSWGETLSTSWRVIKQEQGKFVSVMIPFPISPSPI